ncbi:MAG: FAD-dependent oxidoreductase [Deltaproteobacteria bacterium]|nr:FAD-dependent oxidoreductase [Deltaproteobacteria bacterium]
MALGRIYRPVVDPQSCRSCCVCLRGCPAEALPDLRAEDSTLRGAAYGSRALPETRGVPGCQAACPLGQRVRDYVGELARGRWKDALFTIRSENPLPSICGYLCHHPCQSGCLREAVDAPIAIRELKLLAARYELAHAAEVRDELLARRNAPNGRRVAVVGSGPAGLTAAYDLLLAGCAVTAIEAAGGLGGMLRLAIPGFRLPRAVLDHELSMLAALGLDARTGSRIATPADLQGLRDEFDAVLLALGAARGTPLPVPGWNGGGCRDALGFLREFNGGLAPSFDGTVLVVGGGNVALDAARAALRCGAGEVRVVYRRDRADMPADPQEVSDAEKEGVKFDFRLLPREVERRGGAVAALVCQGTEPGAPDPAGRPLVALTGAETRLPAGSILAAVGQSAEHDFLPAGAVSREGTLLVDSGGRVSGCPGLFGAGDGVTGPSYVVQAMASGRAAAKSILDYLEATDVAA